MVRKIRIDQVTLYGRVFLRILENPLRILENLDSYKTILSLLFVCFSTK